MHERDIAFVSKLIDDEKDYLEYLSRQIWNNPELGFQENFAHELLTSALEKYGFSVQKNYLLPTAFRGEFSNNLGDQGDGPTIAIICEYDALPDIGHACGHNLISESGIASAMAVKAFLQSNSALVGKIVVLGTPAEEGGGGKAKLIELGAFKDIDVALMCHPSRTGMIEPIALAVSRVHVTYKGKEAHASAFPWEGKNALDAAVACYNSLSLLRQQTKPSNRIHVIITKGGVAVNIIPGESEMMIAMRAPKVKELESLREKVTTCIDCAAISTGCSVEKSYPSADYFDLIHNKVLLKHFEEHAKQFDLKFASPSEVPPTGSTDMGNVSHVVPAIHPFFGIGGKDANHSKGFAEQAATAEAQIVTLAVSKCLALLAIKLLKHPDILQDVKESFLNDKKTN